jgi:predicted alpha/beta hydrolase family esterase
MTTAGGQVTIHRRVVRAVLLHGIEGYPSENWFPWLAENLQSRGFQVEVPHFPSGENLSLSSWIDIFARHFGTLQGFDIVIGHSLGAVFALRLVEQLTASIRAAFLVSAFVGPISFPPYARMISSFFASEFNWPYIRAMSRAWYLYHADNDPIVPLASGLAVARHLDVPMRVIPGGGHLNSSAGFVKFDTLFADVLASAGFEP